MNKPMSITPAKVQNSQYISVNPKIMGGIPVIEGTRIPIARIIFLLKDGYTVDAIADDFSWVDKKKIEGAIDEVIKDYEKPQHASATI